MGRAGLHAITQRWTFPAWLLAAGCAAVLLGACSSLSGSTAQAARSGTVAASEGSQAAPLTQAGSAPIAPSDPPAPPTDATPGTLQIIHFYSRALRQHTDYLVYLPRAYDPAQRLPAFYMLHGMPGRPLAFTVNGHVERRLESLITEGRVPPFVLVFPDGRINGNTATDSEWANTSAGRYDSYIADVVKDVDARFATIPKRQDRVIAGLSAGAYGAINVGLHHLDLFGSLQVWSGYFTQTRTGVFARANGSQLAYNSPIDFVRTLGRELAQFPLRAFLFVGEGDSDRGQLPPMAAALAAKGAQVQYAIYPGGHSWTLWDAHLDQMLLLAGRDVRHPVSSASSHG